ncbi:MAG: hypothetical protein CYPHOPRED_000622 [Cyphobasidiales sp. Tagirdzhanova-0007]|nr:MAG: hypothetical protein CYPHOPRED_000622 [Cyphobasidiales sp. Tagirdzhanova-0007]
MYTLYQRDRPDAPEPLAMFFYNTDVIGDWWYNLPLDHHFDNENDAWASMRSSWTNDQGIYAAMKAGNLTGHQTHGDLDAGDFVLEALGQRWAGQLCQDNYLSTGYFSGEAADSQRWLYYRCRTEGQNTILMGDANQNPDISPATNYDTTGEEQNSLTYAAGSNSAAYFWSDLSSAYSDTVRRGLRLLNSRQQVLIQDEINTSATSQWRMHTNATISYSNGNRVANLALGGQTMTATIMDSALDITFETLQPVRNSADPALPSGQVDLPNPGVSVLAINIPAGNTTLQVLFNPQWPGLASSAYVTPPNVALSSWSLTSHD